MYKDHILNNPSIIKRYSHARRFEVALDLLEVRQPDEILDVGTGDGYMLHKIIAAGAAKVIGYEPVDELYQELSQLTEALQDAGKAEIIRSLDKLEYGTFGKICCLEVFEHLPEQLQQSLLTRMHELLHPTGIIVVSVPIEVGFASLMKNIVRWGLGQAHPNASIVTVLKSFLGRQIERGSAEYYPTHVGFDYRNLEALVLAQGFNVTTRTFSPFSALPGCINSQVFYILRKQIKTQPMRKGS